jgi:hypothetical protein
MGKANELCHALNKDRTYRVYNKANGEIACMYFEGNRRMKELKFAEFKRE